MAFKSAANTFTPPATPFTLVQAYNMPGNNTAASCTPACSAQTIPSTGSGNLLVLVAADYGASGTYISSVSAGGMSFTIPTGANTCKIATTTGRTLSCAYVLSSTSGVTSVTPTMSGSDSTVVFAWYEVHRPTGSFVLDVQNSSQRAAATSFLGADLTALTGTNDFLLQCEVGAGGMSSQSLYPGAVLDNNGFNENLLIASAGDYYAQCVVLLNSANGTATTWQYPSGIGLGPSAAMGLAAK
jgi:hypothetical protein